VGGVARAIAAQVGKHEVAIDPTVPDEPASFASRTKGTAKIACRSGSLGWLAPASAARKHLPSSTSRNPVALQMPATRLLCPRRSEFRSFLACSTAPNSLVAALFIRYSPAGHCNVCDQRENYRFGGQLPAAVRAGGGCDDSDSEAFEQKGSPPMSTARRGGRRPHPPSARVRRPKCLRQGSRPRG
jgi:hypothetical protein